MLTIVFYATNGSAAKQRARAISAEKTNHARCYDVAVWDGTPDKCDSVEIMPDVPGWQRARITQVYGEVEEYISDGDQNQPEEEVVFRKPMGLMPPKESDKKAVHRGGGRWFVMSGDDIISGPHDKIEATRLATEEDITQGA